jgi:hypothetical protein
MNVPLKAVLTLLLALPAASIGAWAEFWPHGFFRSFPVAGHPWVSGLGPYNEHLVRDFGGLYLALAVGTVLAVKAGTPEGYRLVGVVWTTFALLHLAFHLDHLEVFSTADVVGNLFALGGQLLLGLGLLVRSPSMRRMGVAAPMSQSSTPVPSSTGNRQREEDR